MVENGNLGMFFQFFHCSGVDGEIISPDNHDNLLSVLCEEEALFHSCITAANDEDSAAGEKFAVAGSTVGYAMAPEFCFTRKACQSWMSAAGINDTESFEITAAGMDGLIVSFQFKACHISREKFGAEGFSLSDHFRSQLLTAGMENAGVVDNFRCNGNLAAHLFFFDDQYMKPCPCHINSGGEPCRSSAYYYGIINCIHDAS